MKLIVIGGSGYIGSNIALNMHADAVAYYSRTRNKELDSKGVQWIEGSILNAEKVAEAVKDYDTVVDAAGVDSEKNQKFFDVHVTGMKNIVEPLLKYDSGQRLIHISSINVYYGQTDYLRSKGIAEDNAARVKNHLNVRPSVVFGNNDRFVPRLFKLAADSPSKLPGDGNISPVHILDLIKVIESAKDLKGAVDVSSREKISFAEAVNLAREKTGRTPVRIVEKGMGYGSAVEKLKETRIFEEYEIDRYLMNLYRENTYIDRFVKEPVLFTNYIKQYDIKA